MRLGAITILGAGLIASCGERSAECGEAECADICADSPEKSDPSPAALQLTEFEQDLFEPVLADVRAGVRPYNDQAVGICRGIQKCDEFLGLEVEELPPGKYMVRAELEVPDIGDKGTWTVDFSTHCEIIRQTANGEKRSDNDYQRSYPVVHSPAQERGFRLQPLRTIESPSTLGRRECTWKISMPQGGEAKVYEGSWVVPAADSGASPG